MGLESIHDQTLKIIKKGLTPAQVERAVGWVQDLGIKVVIAFMLGLPYETKEMVMQTIDFVRRINLGPDLNLRQ